MQFTPGSANASFAVQAVDVSGEFGDAPPPPVRTAAAWGAAMIQKAHRRIPIVAAFDNFS